MANWLNVKSSEGGGITTCSNWKRTPLYVCYQNHVDYGKYELKLKDILTTKITKIVL